MAIPPRYAAQRWGCAVCGAYPSTTQVFFHEDASQAEETEAARLRLQAVRSQPGWTGPQRLDLPHGVWLCAEHAVAAERHRSQGRGPGLAALKASVG